MGNKMIDYSTRLRKILVIGIFAIVLISSFLIADCICTKIYMNIGVRVLDAYDNPVNDLHVETRFINEVETSSFEVESLLRDYHKYFPGQYIIIGDDSSQKVSVEGDTLLFTGKMDDKIVFQQQYIVKSDSCHCHVYKVAGPEIIYIEDTAE